MAWYSEGAPPTGSCEECRISALEPQNLRFPRILRGFPGLVQFGKQAQPLPTLSFSSERSGEVGTVFIPVLQMNQLRLRQGDPTLHGSTNGGQAPSCTPVLRHRRAVSSRVPASAGIMWASCPWQAGCRAAFCLPCPCPVEPVCPGDRRSMAAPCLAGRNGAASLPRASGRGSETAEG